MPRAHRYYIPGYIWHLTHRCHNREFLLGEATVRMRWMHWLQQARVKEGLTVLNYSVTCNHVHLLVADDGSRETIPRSMQLIEGQTAQEFNSAKSRHGAFWDDRYHATAVDTDRHLVQCMAYIDLNMVRAGIVGQPGEWLHCGFHEIREPKVFGRTIDTARLMRLLRVDNHGALVKILDDGIRDALLREMKREPKWTDAVAVGGPVFLTHFKEKLLHRGKRRSIEETGDGNESYLLREESPAYGSGSDGRIENDLLTGDNSEFWK